MEEPASLLIENIELHPTLNTELATTYTGTLYYGAKKDLRVELEVTHEKKVGGGLWSSRLRLQTQSSGTWRAKNGWGHPTKEKALDFLVIAMTEVAEGNVEAAHAQIKSAKKVLADAEELSALFGPKPRARIMNAVLGIPHVPEAMEAR